MSATEIIEQIKKLPPEEQQKIAAFLDEFGKTSDAKPDTKVSESFKSVADKVFTTNAELFRKLAQ